MQHFSTFLISWHTEKMVLFVGHAVVNWKGIRPYGLHGKNDIFFILHNCKKNEIETIKKNVKY